VKVVYAAHNAGGPDVVLAPDTVDTVDAVPVTADDDGHTRLMTTNCVISGSPYCVRILVAFVWIQQSVCPGFVSSS
jgi:hypothetical protein